MKKRVFVASSSEYSKSAKILADLLTVENIKATSWAFDENFILGRTTIEALEKVIENYDFGVFLFFGSDEGESRGQEYEFVRDNVIFEAGMFIGKQSRFHGFILLPKSAGKKVKPMSDIHGLTYVSCEKIESDFQQSSIREILEDPADQILRNIKNNSNIRDEFLLSNLDWVLTKLQQTRGGTMSEAVTKLYKFLGDKSVRDSLSGSEALKYFPEFIEEFCSNIIRENSFLFNEKEEGQKFVEDCQKIYLSMLNSLFEGKDTKEEIVPQLPATYIGAYDNFFSEMGKYFENHPNQKLSQAYEPSISHRLPKATDLKFQAQNK